MEEKLINYHYNIMIPNTSVMMAMKLINYLNNQDILDDMEA